MKVLSVLVVILNNAIIINGELVPLNDQNNFDLLKTFITTILPDNEYICFFQDHENELVNIISRIFAVYTADISMLNTTIIQCNLYIFSIEMSYFRDITSLVPPHKTVIIFPFALDVNMQNYIEDAYAHAVPAILVNIKENKVFELFYVMDNETKYLSFNNTHNQSQYYIKEQQWSPEKFLTKTGRPIMVTTFHCPPFVEVNNKVNSREGFEYKIVEDMIKDWPVQYNIIENDRKDVLVNKFLLAIRTIQEGKSDIAFCFLWQRALMERNVDYSSAMFPTCVTFLVHKPTLLKSYTFLFQAFHDVLTFVLFAFASAFWEIIFKIVITIKGRSVVQFLSVRLVFICSTTFYFLFFSYYSAELTVISSFPRFSGDYVKSFTDMVDRKIQWVEPQNDIQTWLKNTKDNICVGIAENFRTESNRKIINLKLQEGQFGFLVKRFATSLLSGVEDLDDYGKTYLRALPGCLATFYSSIGFQKNSPFTKYFNEKLYRYFDSGLVEYWERMVARKPAYSYMENFKSLYVGQITTKKFDINKLSGIFYILILGYSLSVCCFVYEYFKLSRITNSNASNA